MSSSLAGGRKNVGYYLWVVIALCFIFLFSVVVPPFAGITEVGVGV